LEYIEKETVETKLAYLGFFSAVTASSYPDFHRYSEKIHQVSKKKT